ncbi:MAG: hypothetical protein E3J64_03250 [Anaerolineales bacterium]|nr:MAG: hypothetical protein E3J64_03250 [Anaerolineales bacterium]
MAFATLSMALAACATAPEGREATQDIGQTQTAPAPSDVSATPARSPFADEPLEAAVLEERSGLRLLRATVTAQGGMIDLRYEVVDAAKANLVLERLKEAVIIDEATGKVASAASVAKLGELRQLGSNRPGQVNYILFANPGGAIKPGALVVVVAGDMPLGRLVVQ